MRLMFRHLHAVVVKRYHEHSAGACRAGSLPIGDEIDGQMQIYHRFNANVSIAAFS